MLERKELLVAIEFYRAVVNGLFGPVAPWLNDTVEVESS